jgi:hypothetical protein
MHKRHKVMYHKIFIFIFSKGKTNPLNKPVNQQYMRTKTILKNFKLNKFLENSPTYKYEANMFYDLLKSPYTTLKLPRKYHMCILFLPSHVWPIHNVFSHVRLYDLIHMFGLYLPLTHALYYPLPLTHLASLLG